MQKMYRADKIDVGYHPDGYRIDKTVSPMNRYTKWDIREDGKWINPKPVCFDSMPEDGWKIVKEFDWENIC